MHCSCQDGWDLTDPPKPTGEGPASEKAGPDILIFWSLDISSVGITHGEEANAVQYPTWFAWHNLREKKKKAETFLAAVGEKY